MAEPTSARPAALSDDQLLHLNRQAMVGQFVAAFAHELNNPLQVIGGLVDLMSDRHDLPPDVQTKLGKVADHTRRASATVQELLGFARERAVPNARVSLSQLVEEALALRRYPLGRAHVTVTAEVPPGERCEVRGTHQDLLQLLLNLVMNAEQSLASLEAEKRLRISLSRTGEEYRMEVADNGSGLPAGDRELVFEPFVGGGTVEPTPGLGLPAARLIARRHGGEVTLHDAPEGGVLARVELPAF